MTARRKRSEHMGRKPVGGVHLEVCPHCPDEELLDMGYDKDSGHYEKQCPKCCRMFRRVKGYGHRWYEIDEMEL